MWLLLVFLFAVRYKHSFLVKIIVHWANHSALWRLTFKLMKMWLLVVFLFALVLLDINNLTQQTYTLKLMLTCHTSCAATIFPTAACDALQCMADSLGAVQIICTRPPQQCRELQCTIRNSTISPSIRAATLTLLPCNQPAALQLIFYNTTDGVTLNETLNSTTTFPTYSLMVTVDHPTNSIGIGVKCGVCLY